MLRILAELTDDEIRIAPAISVVVTDGKTQEPVYILPPRTSPISDTPIWLQPTLCIVVTPTEGIEAAEERVSQVIGEVHG